jgi:hypothetical protein
MKQKLDAPRGALARAGHKLLVADKRGWEQTSAVIARFLEVKTQDLT